MPLARVTATLPKDLVAAADRLARELGVSRSAILAEALRRHVSRQHARPGASGRVAEASGAPYPASGAAELAEVGDTALLAELQRRLAARGGAATVEQAPGVRVPGAPRIRFDRDKLAELCQRHHIRKLSLFGSVLRGDFGPDSDVDVLVEFEPGQTPGFGIITIEDELGALFGGRRVDLVTAKSLHRLIRDRVLASTVVQYAA